jgi:plastocyanin
VPEVTASSTNPGRVRSRRFPTVLVAASLVTAGALAPAFGAALRKPAPGVVGMRHEHFATEVVHLSRGQRLHLQNDSRWIHIIGAGRDGHLRPPGPAPVADLRLMQQNDSYVTGPWTVPGTYYLTCSVHPEMTVKVVVTD